MVRPLAERVLGRFRGTGAINRIYTNINFTLYKLYVITHNGGMGRTSLIGACVLLLGVSHAAAQSDAFTFSTPWVPSPPAGQNYEGVRLADLNGNGYDEWIGHVGNSVAVVYLDPWLNGWSERRDVDMTVPLFSWYDNLFYVADVTGDEVPEFLAIGNNSGGTGILVVRRGLGTGAFAAPQITTLPIANHSIDVYPSAIGDIDGDGVNDVVVQMYDGSKTRLICLVSDGDGTFTLKDSVPLALSSEYGGIGASLLQIADQNRDGTPDLVANLYPTQGNLAMAYFPGQGDGTFDPQRLPSQSGAATADYDSITSGQLNNDGYIDFVRVHPVSGPPYNFTNVTVTHPIGFVTFILRPDFETPPRSPRLFDMDCDGRAELLLGKLSSQAVDLELFRYPGEGYELSLYQTINRMNMFWGVDTHGDINGDGHTDIATTMEAYILMGEAEGRLAINSLPADFTVRSYHDFNNDAVMDAVVVIPPPSGGSVLWDVHLGTPAGGFVFASRVTRPADTVYQPPYDVNMDGKADLVARHLDGSGDVTAFYGNGQGAFDGGHRVPDPRPPFDLSTFPNGVDTSVAFDFDHDGAMDQIGIDTNTAAPYAFQIHFARNTGGNTYQLVNITLPSIPSLNANRLVPGFGDFTNDGIDDLVIMSSSEPGTVGADDLLFIVCPGRIGSPYLDAPIVSPFDQSAFTSSLSNPQIADANGDGNDDLLFEHHPGGELVLAAGDGDGTFSDINSFVQAPTGTFTTTLHDFDQDGDIDVLSSTQFVPNLSTQRNRSHVYVDFTNRGPYTGDRGRPYPRFLQGLGVVADGGTLTFIGNAHRPSTPDTIRIETPLRLNAIGGPVRIGQQ